VATVLAAGAVIVAANLYEGQRTSQNHGQAASNPPTTASHQPSAGPSRSPSAAATAAAGPTVRSSAKPWVGGVAEARRFILRLPARIQGMHCLAQATDTTPSIPTVTCGDQQKTSIIYSLYPTTDAMYSDFEANLDPNVPTSGDCAKTQSHALTTYTRGPHHGRILCEAEPSSGFIGWTDDTTLVWGQMPPSTELTYKQTYDLWTVAVDIAPA
jgi:hypothetical protein